MGEEEQIVERTNRHQIIPNTLEEIKELLGEEGIEASIINEDPLIIALGEDEVLDVEVKNEESIDVNVTNEEAIEVTNPEDESLDVNLTNEEKIGVEVSNPDDETLDVNITNDETLSVDIDNQKPLVGHSGTVSYDNDDPWGTQKVIPLTAPAEPSDYHKYVRFSIRNPSEVTALKVTVLADTGIDIGEGESEPTKQLIGSFIVPSKMPIGGVDVDGYADKVLSDVWPIGEDAEMIITNMEDLGVADEFDIHYQTFLYDSFEGELADAGEPEPVMIMGQDLPLQVNTDPYQDRVILKGVYGSGDISDNAIDVSSISPVHRVYIINNNESEQITMTINDLAVTIQEKGDERAKDEWLSDYDEFTSIGITGESLAFELYVYGMPDTGT